MPTDFTWDVISEKHQTVLGREKALAERRGESRSRSREQAGG